MPERPPDNSENGWLRNLSTRVDGLWDWMHTKDAEDQAFWKAQSKCNEQLEADVAKHTEKLHTLDLRVGAMAVKIGLVSALGAIVGGAVMSWLLATFRGG